MWVIYQGVEERKNMVSNAGNKFDCFVLHGIKKGYQGEPDKPYEKILFPSTAITVVERGLLRNGMSLLQFLQKACQPGDLLDVKSERDRNGTWRWTQIEKKGDNIPTYEPLSDEDFSKLSTVAAPAVSAAPSVTPSSVSPSEVSPTQLGRPW